MLLLLLLLWRICHPREIRCSATKTFPPASRAHHFSSYVPGDHPLSKCLHVQRAKLFLLTQWRELQSINTTQQSLCSGTRRPKVKVNSKLESSSSSSSSSHYSFKHNKQTTLLVKGDGMNPCIEYCCTRCNPSFVNYYLPPSCIAGVKVVPKLG